METSLEVAIQLLRNRGIEIKNCGDAFSTLEYWLSNLDDGLPFSANFSALSRYCLKYVSGTGNTQIRLFFDTMKAGIHAGEHLSGEEREKQYEKLEQEIKKAQEEIFGY